MSLGEVLELFRSCYELAPFTFNNGNTFASFAKILVEDWANTLPAVEAQIVRTTVSHYAAGHVGKKELAQVLEHFKPSWNNFHIAKPASAPTPHVFQEPLQIQPGA